MSCQDKDGMLRDGMGWYPPVCTGHLVLVLAEAELVYHRCNHGLDLGRGYTLRTRTGQTVVPYRTAPGGTEGTATRSRCRRKRCIQHQVIG